MTSDTYRTSFDLPYIHSVDETGDFPSGMGNIYEQTRKTSEKTISIELDSAKMPPPKFPSAAPSAIKKRKSKRSMDYGGGSSGVGMGSLGAARSAPVTPTSDRSSTKVLLNILDL